MVLTRKLQDHNWAEVEERASAYVQFTEISSDEGHGGEEAPCGAMLRYCRNVRPTWVKFDSKDTKESEIGFEVLSTKSKKRT